MSVAQGESAAASQELAASYDEMPYRGRPFGHSHPDTAATVATLYGLQPADVAECRVLELGCGDGGNLIPMALTLPGSRFVGLDLSPRQVDDGRQLIAELGLTNIDLACADLMTVDETYGRFDYILCHGVYSWVPASVRGKILSICRDNLAPAGLAYISFNTFPGWHLRRALREILLYESGPGASAKERVTRARQTLAFLGQANRDAEEPYGRMLRNDAEYLATRSDEYLFHEYLEAENNPFYLHEFIQQLGEHGLGYVGDTEIDSIDCHRLASDVYRELQTQARDPVDFEQRADIVLGRTFRRALVARRDGPPRQALDPDRVALLWLASCAQHGGSQQLEPGVPMEFRLPTGATLTTGDALGKALLVWLAQQWPQRVPFAAAETGVHELLDRAGVQLPGDGDARRRELAGVAYACYPSRFVQLHVHAPQCTVRAGERPLASALARVQAARGLLRVTNLQHVVTELHPLQQVLLPLLDGTRDREAILEALVHAAATGGLNVQEEGQPIRDPDTLRRLLGGAIERALDLLAYAALLAA